LPDQVLWLLERVNHPAVRLNFDISHFDIRGIGIDECVPQMVPYSVHTHVKDQRGLYPHHEFLTPGSGPFDFVHYLTAMHEAGYTGFIGMEVSVMVQRKPGYDPFVDAALGYYALRRAFNESGVPLDG
jgi:inosose dehydratase